MKNTAIARPTDSDEEDEDEEDEDVMDVDDDEAGDDKKYCLCQNVSFGDMVACDNDDCPYEWFHWSCVGLKSEPNGTWYCPVCAKKIGTASAVPAPGRSSSSSSSSNNNNTKKAK